MGAHSPFLIRLTAKQRAALEETARAYTAPYNDVIRAKIVLLAADKLPNVEIAARLDTSPQVVSLWRKRFFEEGLEGLRDRKRSGRPSCFSPYAGGRGQGAGL